MKETTKIILAIVVGALAMLLFINLFSNTIVPHGWLSSHYCPMMGG